MSERYQDGVAAVDRAEVHGDDPALRFVGGAVFVADEAQTADFAIAVSKLRYAERLPQLAGSLAVAKKVRCSSVLAKLDRLKRYVAFIAGLMALRVPFIAATLGALRTHVDRLPSGLAVQAATSMIQITPKRSVSIP